MCPSNIFTSIYLELCNSSHKTQPPQQQNGTQINPAVGNIYTDVRFFWGFQCFILWPVPDRWTDKQDLRGVSFNNRLLLSFIIHSNDDQFTENSYTL